MILWQYDKAAAALQLFFRDKLQLVAARQCLCFFCQLFRPLFLNLVCPLTQLVTPLNIPKVNDLVLGKIVPRDVEKGERLLQEAGDPCFLLCLILEILLKPLFCLFLATMCILQESFHLSRSSAFFSAWLQRSCKVPCYSEVQHKEPDCWQIDRCQCPCPKRWQLPSLPFWQPLANQHN